MRIGFFLCGASCRACSVASRRDGVFGRDDSRPGNRGRLRHEVFAHTLAVFAVLALTDCAARRPAAFRVVPASPEYMLEAPDASRTRFSEILSQYAGAELGWADLREKMSLQIEQAYFREGAETQDIRSFIGLESVRYAATASGALREAEAGQPLAARPASRLPVRTLLTAPQRKHRHHRLYFQLLLDSTEDRRAAVLLSASSRDALQQLADRLAADPAAICRQTPGACTIFPEHCSVSLQLEIEVDGEKTNVPWGTRLARIAKGAPNPRLYRSTGARHELVSLDPTDSEALAIPLLPGDRVETR